MKVYWLNDAVTIKSDNAEERRALALLLQGLSDPATYKDEEERPDSEAEQGFEVAISR